MLTRIINLESFTADSAKFFNVRLSDSFETYKKVNEISTLVKSNVVCFKATALLHDLKEANVFADDDYTMDEIPVLLKRATIDLEISQFKEGDKYVDDNGTEQTHTQNGTSKRIKSCKLSSVAVDDVLAIREENAKREKAKKDAMSAVEARVAEFEGKMKVLQSMNVDLTKLSFNL